MKGSARVTRAGEGVLRWRIPTRANGGFFKKNRCICSCGTFGRAGKGGQRSRGWWGKVFAGRVFFFGLGWENLAGKGVVGFFLGGLDLKIVELSKTRPLFNQPRDKRSILL